MDLWIRSQNKKRLIKADNLQIIYNTEDKEFPYYINASYEHLGAYKIEERAWEILNEIQSKITQNECLKLMIPKLSNIKGEEENIGKLIKEMIYEMPEE